MSRTCSRKRIPAACLCRGGEPSFSVKLSLHRASRLFFMDTWCDAWLWLGYVVCCSQAHTHKMSFPNKHAQSCKYVCTYVCVCMCVYVCVNWSRAVLSSPSDIMENIDFDMYVRVHVCRQALTHTGFSCLSRIIENRFFNMFMLLVIFANCVALALQRPSESELRVHSIMLLYWSTLMYAIVMHTDSIHVVMIHTDVRYTNPHRFYSCRVDPHWCTLYWSTLMCHVLIHTDSAHVVVIYADV